MPVVHNPNSTEKCCQIDTHGIRLSTYPEHTAVIIAAGGDVDSSNIDRLAEYVRTALGEGRAIVLDLTELTFLGAQGIPALFAINEQASKVGVDWALVPSHAVRRLLRIGDRDHRLPTVGSVPEAMKRLTTPRPARRLLQLVTESG
jgi:anti-anti-sigma factor